MSTPQKNDRQPYLDGWRGIAILLVLISHFEPFGLSGGGGLGVQLFYALSGYLMADVLFIKQVALPTFFARRASRILPVFIVFVLAMLAYSNTFQPKLYSPSFAEVAATLTFLRSYLPGDVSIWADSWAIGNLWSLNVEEHSYILLAVVALVARASGSGRFEIGLLWSAVAVSLGFAIGYQFSPPSGASPWFVRSECAALGLLSAAAIRVARDRYVTLTSKWIFSPVLGFACLAIAFICMSLSSLQGWKYTLAPILIAFSINCVAQAPALAKRLLENPALRWFGCCSFSLYLWQQPFYLAAKRGEIDPYLGLLGAMIIASLSFYCLEQPVREYLNDLTSRRLARRAVAKAAPT